MALERKTITVPLGGRLDESVDGKLLDAGAMARAVNCLYDKHGRVIKAPGAELISYSMHRPDLVTQNPYCAEAIQLGGGEQLVVGSFLQDALGGTYLSEGHQAVGLDAEADTLRMLGPLEPIEQSNHTAVFSNDAIRDPAVARSSNGYVWVAWAEGFGTPKVYLSVYEEATGTIIQDRFAITTGAVTGDDPQIIIAGAGATERVHVYYSRSNRVYVSVFDPTTPAASWVYTGQATNNFDAIDPIWDVCSHDDPTWGVGGAIVYKDAAGDLVATFIDYAGIPQRTLVVAAGYACENAICCASVTDRVGVAGNKIAWATQENAGAGVLWLVYGMIEPDFSATTFLPWILLDISSTPLERVTLAEDPAHAWEVGAASSAVRVWAQCIGSYRMVRSVRASFVRSLIGAEDSQWHDYRLQTKAFYYAGRSHCWLFSEQPDYYFTLLASYGQEDTSNSCRKRSEAVYLQDAAAARTLTHFVLSAVNSAGSDGEFLWASMRVERAARAGSPIMEIVARTLRVCRLSYNARGLQAAQHSERVAIGGGVLHCHDGRVQDHGFAHAPLVLSHAAVAGGSVTTGDHYYMITYEWTDRTGAWHVSAPSAQYPAAIPITVAGLNNTIELTIACLNAGEWDRNQAVKICVYRTLAGGATFYFVGYIDNDPNARSVVFTDTMSDTIASLDRIIYTDNSTGSVLPNAHPPPGCRVVSHQDRLAMLSDEDPSQIWYTKPIQPGVAAEWASELKLHMPEKCSAIASTGDLLLAFGRASGNVWAIGGVGPNAFGQGDRFFEPRAVVVGAGCSNPRCCRSTSLGVVYETSSGLQLLSGDGVVDLGSPVEDQLAPGAEGYALVGCTQDTAARRLVFPVYATGDLLIYDYEHDRWSILDRPADAVEAAVYDGKIYTVHTGGGLRRSSGYLIDGKDQAPMTLETPWIRLASLTGFQRIWFLQLLGEFLSDHTLQVDVRFDYDETTVVDTHDFVCTSSNAVPYVLRRKPKLQKCQAIKVTITDKHQSSPYSSCSLAAIEFVAGFKGPVARRFRRSI